jgi:hypothetical protein
MNVACADADADGDADADADGDGDGDADADPGERTAVQDASIAASTTAVPARTVVGRRDPAAVIAATRRAVPNRSLSQSKPVGAATLGQSS